MGGCCVSEVHPHPASPIEGEENKLTSFLTIARVLGAHDNLPCVAGQFSGPLLIMGGAACVRDDLAKVGADWKGGRMAVNDIGAHYRGTLDHWATLHPAYLGAWLAYRHGHNYGSGGHVYTHSREAADGVQFVWPLTQDGGTSGLFACFVGLLLGYAPIVLAGMPCDNTPHYFDPLPYEGKIAQESPSELWFWARDQVFQGRVTSLSGRTRDWLGAP